jgi:hypothetical protein
MSDDYTCEASTGVSTSGIAPLVIMCRQPATLHKVPGFLFEVAMCDKCWDAYKRKHGIV